MRKSLIIILLNIWNVSSQDFTPKEILGIFLGQLTNYSSDIKVKNLIENDKIIEFRFQEDLDIKIGKGQFFTESIGKSLGSYDRCIVIVLLNKEIWDELNDIQKTWLIYHELGHDILNLDHNDLLNDIMNPIIPSNIDVKQFWKSTDILFERIKNKSKNWYLFTESNQEKCNPYTIYYESFLSGVRYSTEQVPYFKLKDEK